MTDVPFTDFNLIDPPEDEFVPQGIYSRFYIEKATSRGFDFKKHYAALVSGDDDEVALTHPSNWLTEEEVEAATRLFPRRKPVPSGIL